MQTMQEGMAIDAGLQMNMPKKGGGAELLQIELPAIPKEAPCTVMVWGRVGTGFGCGMFGVVASLLWS